MTSPSTVSVVIAFRDWGFERLEMCLRSVTESLWHQKYEIIVSDYGSREADRVKEICNRFQATHLYTDAQVWSKPKALNAGFRSAEGDIIISLDADMIVSPTTLAKVAETVASVYPSTAVVASRDLPSDLDAEGVTKVYGDWELLEVNSRRRARWGVGGCFGFHRKMLHVLGGVDERMTRYGAEDLDFTDRCRRMGARVVWLDQPEVRMYHIWHPSTMELTESDPEVTAAITANREIYFKDLTITRNEKKSSGRVHSAPLISVILTTFNRANYLAESINSVLAQSVQDFELLIVDDGSEDNTREVVSDFSDSRIRYFNIENSGIARARNFGFSKSRGAYIAVHDDDDLMFPDRLENSLKAMLPGIGATYGAVLNFENTSGTLQAYVTKMNYGEQFVLGTPASPGHATWLVRRELFESTPYDEKLTAGVDHNVAIRSVAQGWKWAHTQKFMYARRRHDQQVTDAAGNFQQKAAKRTFTWVKSLQTPGEDRQAVENFKKMPFPNIPEYSNLEQSVVAWLPDSLVVRDISFRVAGPRALQAIDLEGEVTATIEGFDLSGEEHRIVYVGGATWKDLATVRNTFGHFDLVSHYRKELDPRNVSGRNVSRHAEVFAHYMHTLGAEIAVETQYEDTVNQDGVVTYYNVNGLKTRWRLFANSDEYVGWRGTSITGAKDSHVLRLMEDK